jgi:hypothetical protein
MCKRYARTVVINDILVFKENIYGIGFDFFALIFILLSYFFTYLQWYKEKMKTKSLIFALFFIIESNFCIMAQVSYGGRPFTLNNVNNNTYLKSLQTKNIVYLSYINNEREKFLADSICTMNGIAKQKFYGKGIDLDINIKDKTSPILLENGNKLWLYNIRSANAYAMQFYFDRFKLPKGATLFFYNEEKDMILGAFTEENNNINLDFGTQYIKGKSIYIEYMEPVNPEFSGELHIFKAIHVFKDVFKSGPYGQSGSCNIDVKCPLGDGWQNEIASVALILSYNSHFNYASWCSGVLLNNTANDGRALFLSANHCCDTTRMPEGYPRQRFDYTTWVFLFNYQDTICDDYTSFKYPTNSVYGAKFLASDFHYSTTSDFLLLELNASKEALSYYGIAYAGWERNDNNSSASPYIVCIHHPNGDVKKISKDNNAPGSNSLGRAEEYFWEVVWNFGTTEYVSSGAPLFNSNHRVIGQLYSGSADCSTPDGSDDFGKLSFSWSTGNLGKWLDPQNTNASFVDTYKPNDTIPAVPNSHYLINPNPSNGKFYIVLSDRTTQKLLSIKVVNSIGKVIIETTKTVLSNNEIDLSNQPKGLYIVIINNGEDIVTEKLILL